MTNDRRFASIVASLALLGASPVALAQSHAVVAGPHATDLLPTGPSQPAAQTLAFEQVSLTTLDGQVINSSATFRPARLPAIFMVTFSDGSVCSATLIGPRVILTAAHCIDQKLPDGAGGWRTTPGGIRLKGDVAVRPFVACEMASAYTAAKPRITRSPRNSHDFALCELAKPVGITAETVTTELGVAAGVSMMVAGYGCTEQNLADGIIPDNPTPGKALRIGFNHVRAERVDTWLTLVGRVGSSDAIICPGDSGGSAYVGVQTLAEGADEGWRVAAVISAVGPSAEQKAAWQASPPVPTSQGAQYVSYLAPLADPDFLAFVEAFMARDDAQRAICGINRKAPAAKCRP